MDKIKALDNLIELDKIFKKNGSEYWLTCGTLLGFYREGDFIGYDSDIDVCLDSKSLNKKVIKDLLSSKFVIEKVFGDLENGFELSLHRQGVKTDIFIFYKDESGWYNSVWTNEVKSISRQLKYVYTPFELGEGEFLGHSFPIPKDVEKYLIEQYGKNFRTPNKNWYWDKSPLNLVVTDNLIPISVSQKVLKKLINE